jgi:late embryogenesis abundant protein
MIPVRCRVLLTVVAFGSACASLGSLGSLGGLIQPPRFSEAEGQPAEIRLVGPSVDKPIGGAVVRIWTRVSNPNAFGFRLATLRTTLLLDGSRAATGDFPLGLPLGPREETVVPLDLSISFSDLAGLSRIVRSAADGQTVPYQLDGTIGIDAGRLGQPTFGPTLLFRGDLSARRR